MSKRDILVYNVYGNKRVNFYYEVQIEHSLGQTNWCIKQFGPNRPRGQHNQKHRKLWSIKEDAWNEAIYVYLRRPEDVTYVTLRWL